MRSGDTRAHLTNSLSASLRLGGGFGMQNGFGPRNAAMFCISTETAPCAKPSQKLTAAVPIALSGVAVQSSTKSAVVAGPKFASVAACAARGARNARAAAAVHRLNVMTPLPPHTVVPSSRQIHSCHRNCCFGKPTDIVCGCLGLGVPGLYLMSQSRTGPLSIGTPGTALGRPALARAEQSRLN